jgi:hypothetical protein
MGTTILGLNAAKDDDAAMSFLELDQNGPEIKKFLAVPGSGASTTPRHQYFYDTRSRSASYVLATGSRVICIRVLNVAREKADEIEAKLANLDISARMSLAPFQDVVEKVLGESINPQHPIGSHLAKWWKGNP